MQKGKARGDECGPSVCLLLDFFLSRVSIFPGRSPVERTSRIADSVVEMIGQRRPAERSPHHNNTPTNAATRRNPHTHTARTQQPHHTTATTNTNTTKKQDKRKNTSRCGRASHDARDRERTRSKRGSEPINNGPSSSVFASAIKSLARVSSCLHVVGRPLKWLSPNR